MRRISKALAAVCAAALFTALTVVLGLAAPASAASLTQVTNFGANPGGAQMYVYVPDTRPANPAIVVALHGCGGTGPGFYSSSEFASLADRYGFIVIYPAPSSRPASATAGTPGRTRPRCAAAGATRSRWCR